VGAGGVVSGEEGGAEGEAGGGVAQESRVDGPAGEEEGDVVGPDAAGVEVVEGEVGGEVEENQAAGVRRW
jgi:hypothetical protein